MELVIMIGVVGNMNGKPDMDIVMERGDGQVHHLMQRILLGDIPQLEK